MMSLISINLWLFSSQHLIGAAESRLEYWYRGGAPVFEDSLKNLIFLSSYFIRISSNSFHIDYLRFYDSIFPLLSYIFFLVHSFSLLMLVLAPKIRLLNQSAQVHLERHQTLQYQQSFCQICFWNIQFHIELFCLQVDPFILRSFS